MRDALYTKRTRRYVIGTLLTGRTVRTADAVASVAAQVAAGSLTTIDGATFGLFDSAVADDSCSITSGAAVLTSSNNPWVAGDAGKAIDVQGAGAAGATLRSRIRTYNSAGSVTLWDNAGTTVAALVSSAGGLAIWGNDLNQSRNIPLGNNEAGTTEYSRAVELILASGSTYARSLADILADQANVKSYGAVGDGVADDTVAIQRAIDSGSGHVLLPKGRYRTTATLTVTTSCVLEGIGANSPSNQSVPNSALIIHDFNGTCIDFIGSVVSDTLASGSGTKFITFIQNDGAATGASGICLRSHSISDTQRSNWIRVENCFFEEVTGKNAWTYCIDFDGTANANLLRDIFITGCRFVSGPLATAAIRLAGIPNGFIADCEANLVNGHLVITGDVTHPSTSIFVNNSTFASVQLDWAQNVFCTGGSSGAYSTTANTQDTVATGWHTSSVAPVILGTRNTVIGKIPTGEVAWTGNNTMKIVAGANGLESSGPMQASAFISATANPASAGAVRLANNDKIMARNAANSANVEALLVDGSNRIQIAPAGADILWGTAPVALGAGGAATLGLTGGSGPVTAAQNKWLRVIDNAGNACWIPVWR